MPLKDFIFCIYSMTKKIVTRISSTPSIIIIGMAGAGKSTIGKALAHYLNWAFVDTDHIIEANYATKLQNIADKLSKEKFLDIESTIIQSLYFNRTVIATGGSVVYRESYGTSCKTRGNSSSQSRIISYLGKNCQKS